MGVRSMATYIETRDVKVFIDPGVALGPRRYGLPPHPIEINERKRRWKNICEYASKSDIIIITHYHYDHYNPKECLEDIYSDKFLILKDYKSNINPSQIRRSAFFLHRLNELLSKPTVEIADNRVFIFGDTEIIFSEPVKHGPNPKLGYVVMVLIRTSSLSMLYTSDIEGVLDDTVISFIMRYEPNIMYLDGPMTYMLGRRYSEDLLRNSLTRLSVISRLDFIRYIILDHHFMRDLEYNKYISQIGSELDGDISRFVTAAEFMGENINILEARRRELYDEYPVEKIKYSGDLDEEDEY